VNQRKLEIPETLCELQTFLGEKGLHMLDLVIQTINEQHKKQELFDENKRAKDDALYRVRQMHGCLICPQKNAV
jgi:hypothetical protein